MEIQQLRYVVALAQELHFLRASEKVYVTQPTLSQQVKKLEEELGTPLFERSNQFVKLTPAGEKFLPYAVSILDTVRNGMNVIQEDQKEIRGVVHLGVIPTICPYLVPEILPRIRKLEPLLQIQLYEETTSVLLEKIKEGKIDMGLLSLPLRDSNFSYQSIGKEPFFIALSSKHRFAQKKGIGLSDFKKERLLILQEGHCFSEQALSYCKQSRENQHVIFQGSSLTSVMKLAESNEGITLVPKMAVDKKRWPKLVFIPFSAPQPSREIGFAWRQSAHLNRAQKFLISQFSL